MYQKRKLKISSPLAGAVLVELRAQLVHLPLVCAGVGRGRRRPRPKGRRGHLEELLPGEDEVAEVDLEGAAPHGDPTDLEQEYRLIRCFHVLNV